MSCELAIRNPSAFAVRLNPAVSGVLERFKERIEHARTYFARTREERIARETFEKAAEAVATAFRNRRMDEHAKTIRIVVCETDEAYVDAYYSRIPNETERRKLIYHVVARTEKAGTSKERHLTCINLAQIRRNCQNPSEVRAALILTAIHELLHHFEHVGYRTVYGPGTYDTRWLNEGFTELTAKRIMNMLYPEDFNRLSTHDKELLKGYEELVSALGKIVGEATIADAYFEKGFGWIEEMMLKAGLSKKDVEEMLAHGQGANSEQGYVALQNYFIALKRKKRSGKSDRREEGGQEEKRQPSPDPSGTKCGFSPEMIEYTRGQMPTGYEDCAERMMLACNLLYHLRFKKEPDGQTMASMVSDALTRANNVPAQAQQAVMCEVAKILDNEFRTVQLKQADLDVRIADVNRAVNPRAAMDQTEVTSHMTRMIEGVYPPRVLEAYTREAVKYRLTAEGIPATDDAVEERVLGAKRYCWQEKVVPGILGSQYMIKLGIGKQSLALNLGLDLESKDRAAAKY